METEKRKNFTTISPGSYNVHLLKDVGMIPYVMYRDYNYNSTLVTYKNEEEYPAILNEVKGLKVDFLKTNGKYTFGSVSFKVISYIWKKAKEIDILNLYHTSKETMTYGLIYKLRNPFGKLYIKLDLDLDDFISAQTPFKKRGYQLFFRYITDIVSYELETVGDYLKQQFLTTKSKFIKIPNGIDDDFIKKENLYINDFQEKEKLIITVGRIGTEQKNSEMLLKVIESLHLKDWKVAFIGPIEVSFYPVIKKFFMQYPDLKERVIFTGAIADRKELYAWYNRAKVFCLTSRWESFGIVLVEALYWNNYILTTPIAPAQEITNGETVGKVVADESELCQALQKIIDGDTDLEIYQEQIAAHATKYLWKDIVGVLHKKIESIV